MRVIYKTLTYLLREQLVIMVKAQIAREIGQFLDAP